ncbi:MAG TPA: Hpt domain-containing protein, partial [Azospirillaceae bacterium]|nr:Hpt domain-containing protein [Azospirillaceae bacterium]
IPHEKEPEERQAEQPPLSGAALNEAVLARYYAALGAQRFGSIRGLLEEAAADGLPRLTAVGDLADVRETAHRLAGAGSHFGLTAFVALMQRIEDLAKDGEAEAAGLAGAAAPAVFAAALAAMDDWLAEHAAVVVASSSSGV